MSKLLASIAAIGALSLVALTPAAAKEQRADGVKNSQVEQWEFSDHRRRYRHRHVVVRRYWAPRRYYGYYRPYYRPRYRAAYYAPYYAYRPHYRPYYGYGGPVFSIGFGFGPRFGWW